MKWIGILLLGCLLTGCSLLPQTTSTTLPGEEIMQTNQSTQPKQEPTVLTTVPTLPTQTETEPVETTPPPIQEEVSVKAMWLSQFDLSDLYFDGRKQRDREAFTQKATVMMKNLQNMGFNTVFLQIRPNADSMYPSQVYPMSRYVVGQYAGEAEYDPVEILTALARAHGLSVHGWINPMRGMKEEELKLVSEKYTIGRWAGQPDKLGNYLVLHKGVWYLNPAYPEVRQLIVDGAREAMERYDFDGLHIDDYFYPTTDESFDLQAYARLGGGRDLDDFRRQNLNALVSALYETAHEAGGVFSVSPAGNLDTVYKDHYADLYTWCSQEGYLDYICPQVYFGMEHENFDFVSVSKRFSDLIHTDTVKLIVGMTFGKALSEEDPYAGSGKEEWKQHKDILKRSLESTKDLAHCRGVAVFCYQYFFDPMTGQPIEATRQERDNFLPVFAQMEW